MDPERMLLYGTARAACTYRCFWIVKGGGDFKQIEGPFRKIALDAWQHLGVPTYPGPYVLRINVYRDRIRTFCYYEDGCVMRQRVDVLDMKLTLFGVTNLICIIFRIQ